MKQFLSVILLLAMGSCLPTRTVTKTVRDISSIQTGEIERTRPSDVIIIEAPKVPNEKPTTIVYKGEHGATTTVDYGEDGEVDKIVSECPEVSERERYDRETTIKEREKISEREFNEMLVKEAKSTILYLGGMLCIAWAIVGIFRVK